MRRDSVARAFSESTSIFSSRACSSSSAQSSRNLTDVGVLRPSIRCRSREPGPQETEHIDHGAQSSQPQYDASWHRRAHFMDSSESFVSQGVPPHSACCTTCRDRSISPPHLLQAPQSAHLVHLQFWGLQDWHGSMPQEPVSANVPAQASPLFSEGCTTRFWRILWPPPQLAVQMPHGSQSLITQSTGMSSAHMSGTSSPSDGLHGLDSTNAPMQNLPSPRPDWATCRDRVLLPRHCLVHSPQSPQGERMQSLFSLHSPLLQLRTSRDRPEAGVPQWFASCSICRTRHVKPVPQVRLQLSQSCHWAHLPSMHALPPHFCVLQGAIIVIARGSQGFPPGPGVCRMSRSRDIWPPSQSQVQALHGFQSPHSQSLTTHSASTQGLVSIMGPLQPEPPEVARCASPRLLVSRPLPQLTEQLLQSLHGSISQSALAQSCELHGTVSLSTLGHAAPAAGSPKISLTRERWPPEQVLSQSLHAVHAEW
mmetsp:Transcript_16713/g.36633  ORF Transcript_16713/g.36633 Transcript_16713/m.36633 type:complete len:481 (-) Transcript_16713:3730-5172(-)